VPEIPFWDEDYEGGGVNLYKDIEEYMALRQSLEAGTERFFLVINGRETHRRDFLMCRHVGKSTFFAAVKNASLAEGVEAWHRRRG